jgi:hypothetical protein
MYPMVEYAHKIGKNTADFTTSDMVNFTKWWMKQPLSKEFIMSTKNNKYNQAVKSRVPVDVEQVDDSVVEELVEESQQEQEVVVEIGLTQQDINALLWGLETLLAEYDFSEMQEVEESLSSLSEALQSYKE